MEIKRNTDMLCLRFVDVGGLDCISEHKKVITDKGFVWFGKIGVKPAKNKVESFISDGKGYILLKKPSGVYLCEFDAYSYRQPDKDVFPLYYNDKELLGMREFTMWFRLKSINEITEKHTLDSLVVKSSREPFMVTANKSMSSMFYIVNRKEIEVSSPTN